MERNGLTIPPAIKIDGYEKHYDRFSLGPLYLEIPQGFTTAIIGENGAGKTTLLDALGGITNGHKKITWLEKYTDLDQNDGKARNEIGWCTPNRYFPSQWTIRNIRKSLPLAFDNFSSERFEQICREFGLGNELESKHPKKLSEYSDGNRARLVLASVLARDTKLMILDEPDAALDPVIRDVLNSKFRQYISNGNGETSILFSTHNIADMESVVDYAVFLSDGKLLAHGFVEDLREQYRYVHNDSTEKLCPTEDAEKYDKNYAVEVPTLQQLAVLILRKGE